MEEPGSVPPVLPVDATAEQVLSGCADSWLTPLTDDDGWTEADLRAVEQRLGVRLPAAMREAYALFGRREDLASVQDRLLGPDQLQFDMTGDMLIYRVENQAVAVWGVPLAAMEHRWFTGPEVLLCDFAGTWLWVRARTTLALDAVRAALPGEWLMLPNL